MAPRRRGIRPVSALRPEEYVLFRNTGILAVSVTAPGYLRLVSVSALELRLG
jgi:hypothetical protein